MKKILFIIALIAFAVGVYNFAASKTKKMGPSSNKLSEWEARQIAQNSCIKGGEALGAGIYDVDSKTWWYEANLNATREGCKSGCVVSEDLKTAKIDWKCEVTPHVLPEPSSEVYCKPSDRKEGACTKEYRPVCGLVEIQCIKAPCNPIRETFSNSCVACSNTLVKSYKEGICNDPLP